MLVVLGATVVTEKPASDTGSEGNQGLGRAILGAGSHWGCWSIEYESATSLTGRRVFQRIYLYLSLMHQLGVSNRFSSCINT